MEPELFYTQERNAIPLTFVSSDEWLNLQQELETNELKHLIAAGFSGEVGNCCILYDNEVNPLKAYAGLGKNKELNALATAALYLPEGTYRLTCSCSKEALLYWSLAQYRFDHYKKKTLKARILSLSADQFEELTTMARAVFLVRNLINTPANDMGPTHLAQVTENLARQFNAEFSQWVGQELLTDNFPAIYTVGQAAADEPRLLQLNWGLPSHPLVTLIGKGVCFDSGGLDIKPSSGMRLMKKDMGGAAQVLGLAQWIMAANLPVRLQVLIPAVENSISGNAFRPGDVITMRNGLTVEIDNTDAEGRLVLADAITLACESKPELIIDFATLTGAARVAVGTEISAFFANDETVSQKIIHSSKSAQEMVWPLPLFEAYNPMLDSSIADLCNSASSPYAGAITAALFLKHFITPSTAWLHFDIMAWNVSNKPGKPEGGEAMGIRTIFHYLANQYQ